MADQEGWVGRAQEASLSEGLADRKLPCCRAMRSRRRLASWDWPGTSRSRRPIEVSQHEDVDQFGGEPGRRRRGGLVVGVLVGPGLCARDRRTPLVCSRRSGNHEWFPSTREASAIDREAACPPTWGTPTRRDRRGASLTMRRRRSGRRRGALSAPGTSSPHGPAGTAPPSSGRAPPCPRRRS